MEWINFRHLFAFWAVCRWGGFRKAAERVHVSQSTISSQVAQLEDYLELELLERSTRSMKITDAGIALLQLAEEIFSRSSEINRVFRDKEDASQPSHIRIGLVGGISRNLVFRLVFEKLQRETGVRMEFFDGSFDELEAMFHRFELDLFFSVEHPRPRDLATVSFRKVQSSPMHLVSVPSRIAALHRREPVELYVLRHPFEGPSLDEVVAERFDVEVEVPVITDDIALLRFLANAGRGIAVMPLVGFTEDLIEGRVTSVPLDASHNVDLFAIYPSNGLHRPLIDAFLEPSEVLATGAAG